VLGPMKNEGNEITQAVLKSSDKVVPKRTIRRLTVAELNSENEAIRRTSFDAMIRAKLGDSIQLANNVIKAADGPDIGDFADEDEVGGEDVFILPEEDQVDASGKAAYEQPFADLRIAVEVLMPHENQNMSAKVIGRSKDVNRNTIGIYNSNPLLNMVLYDVEFADGTVKEYCANNIAQSMYAQVDDEGHTSMQLSGIMDHSMDEQAVEKKDKYVQTKSGARRFRKTTAGWKLLVQWKDGSEQWIPLRILKESNPVEVAEYTIAKGLDDEAAFAWWVPYTMRKRGRIISSVNVRVKKATHKYGIEVQTLIDHARQINKDGLWAKSIDKEMRNVI